MNNTCLPADEFTNIVKMFNLLSQAISEETVQD